MRKTTYISLTFLVLLFFSCGQNSFEKKLNGKWYGINNNGRSIMHFYPDSLIFSQMYRDNVKWNANKTDIEFYLPTITPDSLIKDKITVNYKLSKEEDTLFGIFKNRFGDNTFNFLRAKNYVEFLNKKYEINFSLPENDSIKALKTVRIYGLKVFIGYANNKIVGKTEYSNNLNNLETDIKIFKDSIKPYTHHLMETHKSSLHRRFHLRVFADKKIADSTITKLLPVTVINKLDSINKHIPDVFNYKSTDTVPIRIFRIYKTNEQDRELLDILKGKEIQSNAHNVFN